MKTWTCILAAGAILALAAPAAYSGANGIPHDSKKGGSGKIVVDPATHLVNLKLKNKKQADAIKALKAKNRILAASNKSLLGQNKDMVAEINALWARLGPLLPVPVPVPYNLDDDCLSYLVCTFEQDCRLWGNNCSLVDPPIEQVEQPAEQPAEQPSEQPAERPEPPTDNTSTPAPRADRECVSNTDPAIVAMAPDNYDWDC